jgi:subtilisin family serine protease
MTFPIEPLERREMLAWGPYPQLTNQDDAAVRHRNVTGKGWNIALIDTGVDFNHPALKNKIWTNPGEIAGNGIDDDNSGYVDDVHGWDFYRDDNTPEDENGHGTQLTSIMNASAFKFEGDTYRGVAPGARVIPLKVADPTGRISDLAWARRIESALQWVARNYKRYRIAAVNMSLRIGLTEDYEATIKDELALLRKRGVFLVATTGFRASMNGRSQYPARDPNIFPVGIANPDGSVSDYADWEDRRLILAPGRVPVAMKGTTAIDWSGNATSYAAPHVAAMGALLKQVNPKFSPTQIAAILNDSAARVKDDAGRTFRRLDIDKALTLAKKRANLPKPATKAAAREPLRSQFLFSSRPIPASAGDTGYQPVPAEPGE